MPELEAVYNRHSYSVEKRNALALWADHVLALVKNDRTILAFRPVAGPEDGWVPTFAKARPNAPRWGQGTGDRHGWKMMLDEYLLSTQKQISPTKCPKSPQETAGCRPD